MNIRSTVYANNMEFVDFKIHTSDTEPTNPVVGKMYFDTTLNRLRLYNGVSWIDISDIYDIQLSSASQPASISISDGIATLNIPSSTSSLPDTFVTRDTNADSSFNNITISGTPSDLNHAVRKQDLDSAIASIYPIDLSSDVTGVLSITNGGTGLNTIGNSGQVMRVKSDLTGLEWADVLSGSGVDNQFAYWQSNALTSSSNLTEYGYGHIHISDPITEYDNRNGVIHRKYLGSYSGTGYIEIKLPNKGGVYVSFSVHLLERNLGWGVYNIFGYYSADPSSASVYSSLSVFSADGAGTEVPFSTSYDTMTYECYLYIGDGNTSFSNAKIYISDFSNINTSINTTFASFLDNPWTVNLVSTRKGIIRSDHVTVSSKEFNVTSKAVQNFSTLGGLTFQLADSLYSVSNSKYIKISAIYSDTDIYKGFGGLFICIQEYSSPPTWLYVTLSSGFYAVRYVGIHHWSVDPIFEVMYGVDENGYRSIYLYRLDGNNFNNARIYVYSAFTADSYATRNYNLVISSLSLTSTDTPPSSPSYIERNTLPTSGKVLAIDGSVSLPSMSFFDDKDTGLYRPSDNTLSFVAGGNESFRIDSSGNIGVNYNSPLFKLSINESSKSAIAFGTNAQVGYLTSTDYNGIDITHGAYWDGSNWIDSLGAYTSERINIGQDGFVFYTGSDVAGGGVVNWNSLFRITKDGDVGIGTFSPTSKLDVRGQIIANKNDSLNPSFSFVADTDTGIYSSADDFLSISTAGISRITVSNLGNIGIGIDNPDELLHIFNSDIFNIKLSTLGYLSHYSTNGYNFLGFNAKWNSSGQLIADTTSTDGAGGIITWDNLSGLSLISSANVTSGDVLYDSSDPSAELNSVKFFIRKSDGFVGINKRNLEARLHINDSTNSLLKLEKTSTDFIEFNSNLNVYKQRMDNNPHYISYWYSRAGDTTAQPGDRIFWQEVSSRNDGTGGSTNWRIEVFYNGDTTTRRGDFRMGVAQYAGYGSHQFRMVQNQYGKINIFGSVNSYDPDSSTGTYSVKATNVLHCYNPNHEIVQFDNYYGNTIAILTNSGNLGIGTETPTTKLEVVGQISSDIADSSNPSYSFIGDLDTGIFSPQADTVAVATQGIERLRVTDNGYIGISEASPQYSLDVAGDISSDRVLLSNNGDVTLPAITATSDTDTGIYFNGFGSILITSEGVNTASFSKYSSSIYSDAYFTGKVNISSGKTSYIDAATDPINDGELFRNGTKLKFHDGSNLQVIAFESWVNNDARKSFTFTLKNYGEYWIDGEYFFLFRIPTWLSGKTVSGVEVTVITASSSDDWNLEFISNSGTDIITLPATYTSAQGLFTVTVTSGELIQVRTVPSSTTSPTTSPEGLNISFNIQT